jgi:hypothetical protein
LNPISRSSKIATSQGDAGLSGQAVKPPHNERVAGTQVVKARVELGATSDGSRARVGVDPSTAGPLERVALQRQVLAEGRDARVADELADHRLLDISS